MLEAQARQQQIAGIQYCGCNEGQSQPIVTESTAECRSGDEAHAEHGVGKAEALRDIAAVIGRGLQVPLVSLSEDEAPAHFGWLSDFVRRDLPASGVNTQEWLDWHPSGPGLIADLERMQYRSA